MSTSVYPYLAEDVQKKAEDESTVGISSIVNDNEARIHANLEIDKRAIMALGLVTRNACGTEERFGRLLCTACADRAWEYTCVE